jgi:predicted dinucleotide-binding enzyme
MRIGFIGAGDLGAAAARLFARAGHDVALSNARGPDPLRGLVAALRPNARAMTVHEAAAFGEVVFLAVPWRRPEGLPDPARVAGKVVIDAMNPYTLAGGLFDLGEATSSELVLRRLPGARLVKAFNTLSFETLAACSRPDLPADDRLALFVAGDDGAAKQVVARLIEEIGFTPVDAGPLREGGRRQEPGSPIYDRPMTGREARAALSGLSG